MFQHPSFPTVVKCSKCGRGTAHLMAIQPAIKASRMSGLWLEVALRPPQHIDSPANQ
jgi:lipocalin